MRRRTLFLSLIIAAACAPQPAPPARDPAADQAAIAAIRSGYADAFRAGNLAKIGSFMTDDAHDMENGMPTMIGGTAVAEGLKMMIAEANSQEIEITPQKTVIEGDLAYDRGLVKTTIMPKNGGKAIVDSGRYLVVLRRQADSSWKLVELMGNGAYPMVPAPPAKK